MTIAFTGLLGYGKTLFLTAEALKALKQGKNVFANYTIKATHKGKSPIILKNEQDFFGAFLHEKNALFCVDEAALVFSSYNWNKIPFSYLRVFAQARKRGLDLFYTTQNFKHVLARLRTLTNLVVECTKQNFLGFTVFRGVVYNPAYYDFNIMPNTEMEKKYILGRKFILPFNIKRLYNAYDTFEEIDIDTPNKIYDRYNPLKNTTPPPDFSQN